MNAGKPEDLAQQHREQDGRQRIRRRNQRLQQVHDRLGQDHAGLRLDKQVQRVQRADNHHYRDQDLKRARHTGGDLFRQADSDVVLLQPRIDAGGVDRGDQRGKDPLAREVLGGDFAVGIGCSHQQEGHKRQQPGHHRIEIKLPTKAGTDPDRDKKGHDAHAQVKRQHQLFAIGLGEVEPAAREAVGGVGGEGREDKHQHEGADDHKRQRGGKAIADGDDILLLPQTSRQRRDGLLDNGNHGLI